MSETKFTPGEWYVENGVPGKPRIFSSAKNLLTPIVCECIGARSRRKQRRAKLDRDIARLDRLINTELDALARVPYIIEVKNEGLEK